MKGVVIRELEWARWPVGVFGLEPHQECRCKLSAMPSKDFDSVSVGVVLQKPGGEHEGKVS